MRALCFTTFTYRTNTHSQPFYCSGCFIALLCVVLASEQSKVIFSSCCSVASVNWLQHLFFLLLFFPSFCWTHCLNLLASHFFEFNASLLFFLIHPTSISQLNFIGNSLPLHLFFIVWLWFDHQHFWNLFLFLFLSFIRLLHFYEICPDSSIFLRDISDVPLQNPAKNNRTFLNLHIVSLFWHSFHSLVAYKVILIGLWLPIHNLAITNIVNFSKHMFDTVEYYRGLIIIFCLIHLFFYFCNFFPIFYFAFRTLSSYLFISDEFIV